MEQNNVFETVRPVYYPAYQFNFPPKLAEVDNTVVFKRNVSVQFANMLDDKIMDCIIEVAKENGITDLVVFDKNFVVSAIREKMEREGLR